MHVRAKGLESQNRADPKPENTIESFDKNAQTEIEIVEELNASLKAIAESLGNSTTTIVQSTDSAVSSITSGAETLTQTEVDNLADALKDADAAVSSLKVSLKACVTDLTPAVKTAIEAEYDAAKNAITPFVKPLDDFAQTVLNVAASISLSISGLKNAKSDVENIVDDLVSSLGIPSL